MTRLQALFKLLIIDRQHEIGGWLKDYKKFTDEVAKIQTALKTGIHLGEAKVYVDTSFIGEPDPFKAFAKQIIYAQNNGVATRGQSRLAETDFDQLIADKAFVDALEALIREPIPVTLKNFRTQWLSFKIGRNPLLINRVLAACTTSVSTTVDEGKFENVYQWLLDEGLIAAPGSPAVDWYAKNVHLVSQLRERLREDQMPETKDEHLVNIFVWELFAYKTNPFSLKKQVVRYGPPGTGKTYTAREQVKLLFAMWQAEFDPDNLVKPDEHIETVQFHPSYSYEDFMEGLRPTKIENGKSWLSLQNGIFKDLCIRAARWELKVHHVSPEFYEKWETLTIGDLKPFAEKLGIHWEPLLKSDDAKKVANAVPPYFLIIDEMNRAELSRVLGELMFCLENRGVKGMIQTQYALLNNSDTGMIETDGRFHFFVPHNVYVTGTMNTIDRSVESFDFALRRRFRWERVMPDAGILRHHLRQTNREPWQPLADSLEKLNEAISQERLLGPDYQIGHTYLMNLNYPPKLTHSQARAAVWEDFIRPLIEEYLRGTGKVVELMETFEKAFEIL